MEKYQVTGGQKVAGEMKIQGAKNSVLPILAATVLANGQSVIHNCPDLSDTKMCVEILKTLGARAFFTNGSIVVDPTGLSNNEISWELTGKMRSSIVFLGPLLARCGKARIAYPGGCQLGPRPIDMHLDGLRQMGAVITEEADHLLCETPDGLHGAEIVLSFPSVGTTENLLMAAATAKGETTLINCACEPEIIDLANYLNRCGAKIFGAGEKKITIQGVAALHGCAHTVIGDRIAAATYLAAAAMTAGEMHINGVCPDHLASMLKVLEKTGCTVRCGEDWCFLQAAKKLHSAGQIRTMPYPGFPTDGLPIFLSLATQAEGTWLFVENIFENRYNSITGLARMGAKLNREGNLAIVQGKTALHGANLAAEDLRGGAGLVLAALCAEGTSHVENTYWIERGYEDFIETLGALGAKVKRLA